MIHILDITELEYGKLASKLEARNVLIIRPEQKIAAEMAVKQWIAVQITRNGSPEKLRQKMKKSKLIFHFIVNSTLDYGKMILTTANNDHIEKTA